MQSKLSDTELIEQTLAGDQSAYADLVKLQKTGKMLRRSRRIVSLKPTARWNLFSGNQSSPLGYTVLYIPPP